MTIRDTVGGRSCGYDIAVIVTISILTRTVFYVYFGSWGWEHDSYEHYYQSRLLANHWDWAIAFNTWNKALFTILSAGLINIWDNFWVIKIGNSVIWTIVSIYVYLIVSKRCNSRWISVSAALFSLFDYIAFRGSVSALSEPLAGLVIVLALYYHRSVFGFLTLLRPELVILTLPFFLEKPSKRLVRDIGLAAVPSFVALLIAYISLGDAWYPFRSTYPVSTGGTYGVGTFLYYGELLGFYNPVLLATLLFCWVLRKDSSSLRISVSLVSFVIFHTVLYAFDLMGSAGLPRYFNATIPLFSILLADLVIVLNARSLVWGKYINFAVLFIASSRALMLLGDGSWHHNSKSTPEMNDRLQEFVDSTKKFLHSQISDQKVYSADPVIRSLLELPYNLTAWPSQEIIQKRKDLLVIEPNLQGYTEITEEEGLRFGEIILSVPPRYLMMGGRSDFEWIQNGQFKGSFPIVWRNRNLVHYSNHQSNIYYDKNSIVLGDPSQGGVITFGPYIRLPKSEYIVLFKILAFSSDPNDSLSFDVFDGNKSLGKKISVQELVESNFEYVPLSFENENTNSLYEFRITNPGWNGRGIIKIEDILLIETKALNEG